MIYMTFILKFVVFLLLLASSISVNGQKSESVTYKGILKIKKYESTINYLGEETGDLAVFCFKNKSAVGRAIFSKCKNGNLCQFTGYIKFSGCDVGGPVSATGTIISLKSVKRITKRRY